MSLDAAIRAATEGAETQAAAADEASRPAAAAPASGEVRVGSEKDEAPSGPPAEQVDAMLAVLAEDERVDSTAGAWVGLVVNVMMVFGGVALMAWSTIGMVRGHGSPAGKMMGFVGVLLGFGIAAIGVWIGMRSTRGKD